LIEQNQHYLEAYDWLVKVLEEADQSVKAQSLFAGDSALSLNR
jgi:hypothetical protein